MTLTVQELIKTLQGFSSDALISIKDVDDLDFFLINFTPRGNTLTIIISHEEDEEESEE